MEQNSVKIGMTLDEFIILREKNYPDATGDLSKLLRDIGLASKVINREVNKAGLIDIIGSFGKQNVQNEEVQKLDVYCDHTFITHLANGGQCCGVASEENETFVAVDTPLGRDAHYVVLFDPLDGSSNIDINATIGTIFSIYKRKTPKGTLANLDDFMQPGTEVVAAGYIIYGSSTMMVYSAGTGVNGFTLDPSIGEYCLSNVDIKIPDTGLYYSVNQAHFSSFDKKTQQGIVNMVENGKSLRYVGSMVGDMHRTLLKGGVFMYPATAVSPQGKLRLLYECIPMAFLVKQANGIATNGAQSILNIQPSALHERCPVYIGSPDMVRKFC